MFKLIITITMLTAHPLDMKTFEFEDGYIYSDPDLCERMGRSTDKLIDQGFIRLGAPTKQYRVTYRCDKVSGD